MNRTDESSNLRSRRDCWQAAAHLVSAYLIGEMVVCATLAVLLGLLWFCLR
jgi:hypothetical protein